MIQVLDLSGQGRVKLSVPVVTFWPSYSYCSRATNGSIHSPLPCHAQRWHVAHCRSVPGDTTWEKLITVSQHNLDQGDTQLMRPGPAFDDQVQWLPYRLQWCLSVKKTREPVELRSKDAIISSSPFGLDLFLELLWLPVTFQTALERYPDAVFIEWQIKFIFQK